MAGPLGKLQVILGLDAREFDSGIGRAQKSISGFGKATDLAIGATAGAVAGGLLSTLGVAREWETAFAGVAKTLDTAGMSAEQEAAALDELETELRDLAKSTGFTHTTLAALAEAGGALGVAREDLTDFARVTAMIGETTNVMAEDAAEALGKITTVLGLTADEYENFASTLVALGNDGASTEAEILAIANRMTGTAAVIGMSTSEMLGWSSAMASVGIEAEAGGSSFMRFAKGVQEAVLLGTPMLEKLAETAGMTSDAFSQMWAGSPSEALEAVIVGLGKLEGAERLVRQESLKLSGEIRLQTLIDKLASGSDFLTSSLDLQGEAWSENTAMAEEFEKRARTLDFQMQKFWTRVNDVAITLGEALMPPLTLVAEHVGNLVTILGDAAKAFPAVTNVVVPLVTALSGLTAIRFGARFLGLGALEGFLSSGIGRLTGRLAVPLKSMLGKAFSSAFMGMGTLADNWGKLMGGRFGVAFKIAAAAAIALLWLEVWNQVQRLMDQISSGQAGLQAKVATIPGQHVAKSLAGMRSMSDYMKSLGGGLDPTRMLADTFAGGEMLDALHEFGKNIMGASRLTAVQIEQGVELMYEAAEHAHARGNYALRDEFEAMAETLSMREPAEMLGGGIMRIADVARSAFDKAFDGIIKDPIEDEFAEAREAIAKGFGGIKAALQKGNRPQIISTEDRISNMRKRQLRIERQIQAARKAGDDKTVAYWVKAAVKQQYQLDRMTGHSKLTTRGIVRKFETMGVDIQGVWLRTKREAIQASDEMAAEAKARAADVKAFYDSLDLTSSGFNLISEFANGMRTAIPLVREAALAAAAAAKPPLESQSPPKEGPLKDIDKWGAGLIDAWVGGITGRIGHVRSASDAIAGAFRPPIPAYALSGRGIEGGGTVINVGVLVADDKGIDELGRRMDRRKNMRSRGPMRYQQTD